MQDTNDILPSDDLDDIFKHLAEEIDQDERDRGSRKGGGFTKNYEYVKYAGLETQVPMVFRAMGKNPDFNVGNIIRHNRGPHDARVVQVAEVLNDSGKKIRLVLPLEGQDNNHILWRIINKVLEGNWEKVLGDDGKEKNVLKPKHMAKYPSMVAKVLYSELAPDNPSRKIGLMGRGWKGKQFFVMNGIARNMYAWHQENKHTVVLSKNVNIKKTDDGKVLEFAEPGVPAFSFTNLLATVMGTYGFWENFDYGITRTGLTTPAYYVFNATKTPEVIKDKTIRESVKSIPLTEEERSWAQYDFDKIFKVTSATKILNNFKDFLTVVDANLGSTFVRDATALSEAEKKKWAEEEAEAQSTEAPAEEAPVAPVAPVAPKAVVVEERHDVDMKFQMPGWSLLTSENKALIDSASKDGTEWSIKYAQGVRARVMCVTCATRIPGEFKYCPACGADQDASDIPF